MRAAGAGRLLVRVAAAACCGVLLLRAVLTAAQPPAIINTADPGTDSARQTPVGG